MQYKVQVISTFIFNTVFTMATVDFANKWQGPVEKTVHLRPRGHTETFAKNIFLLENTSLWKMKVLIRTGMFL